jgi:hypothetical protein
VRRSGSGFYSGRLPQLAYEPRLAHARVAQNRHELRPPLLDSRGVGVEQAPQLRIATDKRACEAADATWPHERKRTHDTSRDNPVRFALRGDSLRLLELEGATRRRDGPLADEDGAGVGSLLQSSSDVHRVAADEGAPRASLSDDHFAGVDTDS